MKNLLFRLWYSRILLALFIKTYVAVMIKLMTPVQLLIMFLMIPKMKIKTKILKDKDTNDADIKDGEGCLDKKNIAIMKKKRK